MSQIPNHARHDLECLAELPVSLKGFEQPWIVLDGETVRRLIVFATKRCWCQTTAKSSLRSVSFLWRLISTLACLVVVLNRCDLGLR